MRCILPPWSPARHAVIAICLTIPCTEVPPAQTVPAAQQKPATRRSQRVQMSPLDVRSPNGQVTFTFLPNAERLTFTVALGNTTVIEPSPIVLTLDGYDLSSGVVLSGVVRDEVHERYPWSGVRSTAISESNRARLSLTNDLTSIAYTLEVRVFDDGVAYRHIIPGDAAASRVPDEWSTFNLPAGSTVWYAGMAEGHYEAPYLKEDLAAVQPGEWAGPPLTFKLPQNRGYAIDHRGQPRELQRHGTRVERPRRLGDRSRASSAAELSVRAALRSRGRQAARQGGRHHRRHHDAMACGDDRTRPEYAGDEHDPAESLSATGSGALSRRDQDVVGEAGPRRVAIRRWRA